MQRARAQKEAVAAIVASGGHVEYYWMPDDPFCDPSRRVGPEWLRKLLGDDFFSTVESAELNTAQIENLRALPHVERLSLKGDLTPDVLAQIDRMRSLEALTLTLTRMTDADMANLRGLASVQELDLTGSRITDLGLENLASLPHLQTLRLNKTEITDAGLMRLRKLSSLGTLELCETWVTETGIARLKQKLPNTEMRFSTRISAEERRSIREFIARLPEAKGYRIKQIYRGERARIDVWLHHPDEASGPVFVVTKEGGRWSVVEKSFAIGEGTDEDDGD
jgi:hypothetical protein